MSTHVPDWIVLVNASEHAQRILTRATSSADVCQALTQTAPYSIGRSIQSATRSIELTDVRLKLVSLSQMYPSNYGVINDQISALVHDDTTTSPVLIRHETDVQRYVLAHDPSPWFTSYMNQLNDLLLFNPVLYIHSPVIFLCVLSEHEPDPIGSMNHLSNLAGRRNLFNDDKELSCAKFTIVCVIIREFPSKANSDPSFELRFRETFPYPTFFIDVNTQHQELQISSVIRNVMFDIITLVMVPLLEKHIRLMYPIVQASRKGFRNQVKSFFWYRKPTSTRSNDDGNENQCGYENASVACQTAHLSNVLTLIGDFTTALEFHRLVLSDAHSAENPLTAACADAMCGLCLTLTSASSVRDIISHFESSVATFLNISHANCAVQVLHIVAKCSSKIPSLSRFLASMYSRMSDANSSSDLAPPPIFLEQAAFAMLRGPRPLLRLYAFHLSRAAHMYQKVQLMGHAIRAYRQALHLYQARGYRSIEDHLHLKLGRGTYNIGDTVAALSHFLVLISSNLPAMERQKAFVKEFMVVVNKSKMTSVEGLTLPVIRFSHIVFGSEFSFPQSIEESASKFFIDVPTYIDCKRIWRIPGRPWVPIVHPRGEDIQVHFNVTNPVSFTLNLSDFFVDCTLDDREATDIDVEQIHSPAGTSIEPSQSVLHTITLRVHRGGILRLLGWHWTCDDVIRGHHIVNNEHKILSNKIVSDVRLLRWLRDSTWNDPNSQTALPREIQIDCEALFPTLNIRIDRSSLKEGFRWKTDLAEDLGICLIHGEVVQLQLNLSSNTGCFPQFVRLHSNHPSIICYLPGELNICDQRSISITLVGEAIGVFPVRISYRYDTGRSDVSHQSGVVAFNVHVQPSINIKTSIRHSLSDHNHRIAEFVIDNRSSISIDVHRIQLETGTDRSWSMKELSPLFHSLAIRIDPDQSYTIFASLTASSFPSSIIEFGPPLDILWTTSVIRNDRAEGKSSCSAKIFWSSDSGDGEVTRSERRGVVVIDNLDINPSFTCPVTISCRYPSYIQHDFIKQPTLSIPVEIDLFNCTLDETINVLLEGLEPNEFYQSETRSFESGRSSFSPSRFFWTGISQLRVDCLLPAGSSSLTLHATITRPGVFNMNRIRLILRGDGQQRPSRIFFFPTQRYVQVVQSEDQYTRSRTLTSNLYNVGTT